MEKIFSMPWQSREEALELKLAKKAKHGNSDAFAELYKIHKIYLYKIAYSYVKDENKALDILQECAYKGLLNIHKLKEPKHFKTWITRVLINIAIDFVNKEKNILYLHDEAASTCEIDSVSIEEKLDLYNAMDALKESYKTVIILKYFNDMNIKDISYTMDIPENTVKSHLKRAKESLNKILKEEFLDE